ncbi:MAG: hypothetical protein AAGG01_13690 [Planctomycetota bacterium]
MKSILAAHSIILLAARCPMAPPQITVEETIEINTSSLSLYRPGEILERRYTGDWMISWDVIGRIGIQPPTTGPYELEIRARIGGGEQDTAGSDFIYQGGPIPVFIMSETFQDVEVGEWVGRSGTFSGSVVDFVGNGTSTLAGEERWTLLANHADYNTYLNGALDTKFSFGYYAVSGGFRGTLDLTYRVDPHPSSLACTGGSRLDTYGADGRLYILDGTSLPAAAPVILLEGSFSIPATSLGLCLGGHIRRVPGSFQSATATGHARFSVDPFEYAPGETRAFQMWYRGPSGNEFSDAIETQLL